MTESVVNSTCAEECLSIFQMNSSALNSTQKSLWSQQSTRFHLGTAASFLAEIFSLAACSAVALADCLGVDVVTLVLVAAVLVYLYRKIIVPFDYVQDLDLPGASTKRRDLVNLTRLLRRAGRKLPPPYPDGWYGVLEAADLKDGVVRPVNCFGEALAVFRGEGGQVHALDAHCPHLGANMAAGGTVRGDCIECPFHRWRFSGPSGRCVAIPGVDTVPKSAAVRAWECREVDGMVFVWYHAGGEAPLWEVPPVPQVARGDWRYMARNEFLVPCHLQDIPENGADVAHLNAIHSDHVTAGKSLPTSETYNILGRHIWSGQWTPSEVPHVASVELSHDIRLFDRLSVVGVQVTARQIGPGYVQMEIRHRLATVVILQTVTPLAPLVQRVTHRLYAPPRFKPFSNLLMWAETVMFHRDVMVWTSKEFVSQPLLVKTDRCLKAFRNWFKQFYSETSTTFEDALKNIQSSTLDW